VARIISEYTTEGLYTEKEANDIANKISKDNGLYITSIKIPSETEFCWALTNKFDPNVQRTA